ncbi:MAG: toxin-antitoxin system, antitoxin component, Xre family protein [Calditerrivibrio sp.]|uniref:toxin-antitoxin system, antitoxin component, Xre family protein n=1 Tax=Calditerrivibrio sp. TaxID=2792612 RepID=UPI003D0A086C
MAVKDIIQKEIEKLPDNLLLEVFDFIQFLEIKEQRTDIVKASQKLSDASFQKVWDNEEDSIYDSL